MQPSSLRAGITNDNFTCCVLRLPMIPAVGNAAQIAMRRGGTADCSIIVHWLTKLMIPMADLKAQYRAIRGEIDEAVARVLENAHYILGPEVTAFEAEFAQYQQADHAIGLNSGTSALHLALLAAGVGPGNEV